ncbi:MAG TPA: ribbon-helix-helix protein, CopG family [Acidimicrobiia bacterium]|nr:ribbon-helix-helix protein, CopG family [Acidimicrobiia bacterium]
MRTTIEFDDDTARAIEQLRRDEGLGLSEAVNELIRRGLLPRHAGEPFVQPTRSMGLKIDVSNVAEALDLLEGDESR